MLLKELITDETILKEIATKLGCSVKDVPELEIHMEYDNKGMANWLMEEDSINTVIHNLSSMKVIDASLSLLDNYILNNNKVVKVLDYVLFFYE